MAGEVEGVSCPQADHGPPQDDGVIGRHCGEKGKRGQAEGALPLRPGGQAGMVGFVEQITNNNDLL